MPPARSATSAARSTRTAGSRRAATARSRPRIAPKHFPLSRIKWDRAGRIAMLVVLGFVAYLGIKGGLTLLSIRAQAQQQQAIVRALARQNRRLEQLRQSLNQPATIMKDARALGMVKAGERSYSVTGLSGH